MLSLLLAEELTLLRTVTLKNIGEERLHLGTPPPRRNVPVLWPLDPQTWSWGPGTMQRVWATPLKAKGLAQECEGLGVSEV